MSFETIVHAFWRCFNLINFFVNTDRCSRLDEIVKNYNNQITMFNNDAEKKESSWQEEKKRMLKQLAEAKKRLDVARENNNKTTIKNQHLRSRLNRQTILFTTFFFFLFFLRKIILQLQKCFLKNIAIKKTFYLQSLSQRLYNSLFVRNKKATSS